MTEAGGHAAPATWEMASLGSELGTGLGQFCSAQIDIQRSSVAGVAEAPRCL